MAYLCRHGRLQKVAHHEINDELIGELFNIFFFFFFELNFDFAFNKPKIDY